MTNDHLLVAIGGTTGSGKTALAVELAHNHPNLIILSADSRQVYRELDIGSAKIGVPGTDDRLTGQAEPVWKCEGVSQYLIDIAEPETGFTVADYQEQAYRLIRACWEKKYIPLLVGGSGLYISSVLRGYIFEGAGQESIRRRYDELSIPELEQQLRERQANLPDTDLGNRRRLVRALERLELGLEAVGNKQVPLTSNRHLYVLTRPWAEQRDYAEVMVDERLELGLIDETKKLLTSGMNRDWLKRVGLSYRLVIAMLDSEFEESLLKPKMVTAFRRLMRRQRTWFNRQLDATQLNRDNLSESINQLLASETDRQKTSV